MRGSDRGGGAKCVFTAEEEPNYSGLCVTVTMQTTGLSSGHLATKVHDSLGRVMKQAA